uniref:YbaB/EbfC family nucleoid-associated protein n=1 Tax=Streptomyces anthocyanicus TaxID=68174 RepID=UPI002F906D7D
MSGNGGDGRDDDVNTSRQGEPDAVVAMNPFSGPAEDQLAKALTEIEAMQEGLGKVEAGLRDATSVVRSGDAAVEVTVGSQGQLIGLRFLGGKYRTMGAAELAASVLDAATRARDTMSRRVMEAFMPFTAPMTSLPNSKGIEVDWAALFGPGVLEDPEATSTRASRSRLRDEINEDTED